MCWECVSIVFWSLDKTVLKSDAEGMVGSTPREWEYIINLCVCVRVCAYTDSYTHTDLPLL